MPLQRIDEKIRPKVSELVANNPKWSGRKIRERLEEECPPDQQNLLPSERTIDRFRKAFKELPSEEQREWEWAYWPEAIVNGDLPVEASEALLELIRFHDDLAVRSLQRAREAGQLEHLVEVGDVVEADFPEHWSSEKYFPIHSRVTLRLARWFWYLTKAAPSASAEWRWYTASALAAGEDSFPDEMWEELKRVVEAEIVANVFEVPDDLSLLQWKTLRELGLEGQEGA